MKTADGSYLADLVADRLVFNGSSSRCAFAGNYILITSEGRLDRAPALERLKELQIQDFSMGEIETELHRDTIVVTYSITLRGTHVGQPLSQTPIRRMAVWQQQKSGWMKIADSEVGSQK